MSLSSPFVSLLALTHKLSLNRCDPTSTLILHIAERWQQR